jgi:hypothetical protein
MNNIAVCLRGEVRNWNYTKKAVFKFYESIAYSVDYYYATWDVPYLDQDKLTATFDNRKLVQGILCPSGNDRHRWGALLGPAFLSSHIKLKKKYDLVVDTRFDLVPVLKPEGNITTPGNMEIQTTNVDHKWDHEYFEDPTNKATTDTWAVMTHSTYDQFNYRLPLLYDFWVDMLSRKKFHTFNEIALNKVLKQMNINATMCHWMSNLIVRPSIVDLFPDPCDITMHDSWKIHDNSQIFWPNLSNETKIEYCVRQGLYYEEFIKGIDRK